jgi:hypothetical protein
LVATAPSAVALAPAAVRCASLPETYWFALYSSAGSLPKLAAAEASTCEEIASSSPFSD